MNLFFCVLLLSAPDVAVKTERVFTGTGEVIENGVIVIHKGKIAKISPRVNLPVETKVVDASKLIAYPGLVLAWSSIGVDEEAGGDENSDLSKGFWPFGGTYKPLLRNGFTAVGLVPRRFSGPVSGQGVVIRPLEKKREEVLIGKSFFLCVAYRPFYKDRLTKLFKASSGPGRLAASGKLPVVITIQSPSDAIDLVDFLSPYRSMKRSIRPLGDVLYAVPSLISLKNPCLLKAEHPFRPGTFYRRNVAAALSASKVPVCLLPRADSPAAFDAFRFDVSRLIRTGLPEKEALKAVTIIPARVLGVDWRIGSLEEGKDADFLLLDGDLFNPSSHLLSVYIEGKLVYKEEAEK